MKGSMAGEQQELAKEQQTPRVPTREERVSKETWVLLGCIDGVREALPPDPSPDLQKAVDGLCAQAAAVAALLSAPVEQPAPAENAT